MAQSVAIHLPYLYLVPQAVLEDFSEYVKAILFILDDEHDPQIIMTVLKSWVVFSRGLSGVRQHVGFRTALLCHSQKACIVFRGPSQWLGSMALPPLAVPMRNLLGGPTGICVNGRLHTLIELVCAVCQTTFKQPRQELQAFIEL
ncbi:hypothetical protein AJ78_05380 [Emergomyces pasteurianus Ep9510]|uniref:Uncharacterized protein n=1 Tax=Emergomyces pasteurianus Ep9510 TaxID=1447872 RepID=A0A1J9Q237_9EURO|nr:hypothetical protein AJ78_05380 [Emergomyces pasteurianus Ep9510]